MVGYPWAGIEVLCEGAVIPYYEYHSGAARFAIGSGAAGVDSEPAGAEVNAHPELRNVDAGSPHFSAFKNSSASTPPCLSTRLMSTG